MEMEVYRKPHHDFVHYGTFALIPCAPAADREADRQAAQEVTNLVAERLIKKHYGCMDPDASSAKLHEAGLQANGASDTDTLRKVAAILGVQAVLTGDVVFYGPYDYHVPPDRVPYTYFDAGYDWYGYPYTRRRRGYYYEPGYTATGSRANLKLKLFDADLGAYVWWATGDRSGKERIPQRYAEMVIKKALEKLPVKPHKH